MAEEVGISIVAGGKVTRKVWDKFLDACEEASISFDLNHLGQLCLDDTRNYGATDEERAILREHGIAFRASNDARYDVPALLQVWFPGMAGEMEAPSDQDGKTMVDLADLVAARDAGRTLEEVLAKMEPLAREVPRMVIGRKPATAADLG